MNEKFAVALAAVVSLASAPAFGQQEWEIVIEPATPDSNDLVTISVPDSACYYSAELRENVVDNRISINLHYLSGPTEECLQNNPDAADFSQTIGPLRAGNYSAALFIFWNTRPNGLRATKVFQVTRSHLEALSDGGITGLYFNPEDDGHYISILQTKYNTLVIWNTFDIDGNQAWIYGVGQLEDGRIVAAESYINRSLGLSHGNLSGLQVQPWGTLEVRMDSCLEGTVHYETRLPEFGADQYPVRGEFPIERLAYSKQLGCSEID